MNALTLLAQDEATSTTSSGFLNVRGAFDSLVQRLDILNHPDELLAMLGQLNAVIAATLLIVGILCVLNGYRWHKWVILIAAFLFGFGLGLLLSQHMNERFIVAGAIGLLGAVVAHPLLRFAVAIFGGMTGAFIGANVWTALGYMPDAHATGAVIGFIILGMASFLMFKHVVVLFTSISGAALVVFSGITLLLNIPSIEPGVRASLTQNHVLVPLLIVVAAGIGLVLQEGQKTPEEEEAESDSSSS